MSVERFEKILVEFMLYWPAFRVQIRSLGRLERSSTKVRPESMSVKALFVRSLPLNKITCT